MSDLKKLASDALDALQKIASEGDDSSLADNVAKAVKEASLSADQQDFFVKVARRFESYSTLSAEDLVKRALQRFAKGRDADAIIAGIRKHSADDTVLAAAAYAVVEKEASCDEDDAALRAELVKRGGLGGLAKYIPHALSAIGGGAAVYGLGKGIGALKNRFGQGAGEMRMLQQMSPMLARTGNHDAMLSAIMQLSQQGRQIPQDVWDMYQQAVRYRSNPWTRRTGYLG